MSTNQFQTMLMSLSNPGNSKMSEILHLLLVPQCIQHLQLQFQSYNQIDVNICHQLTRRQTKRKRVVINDQSALERNLKSYP